MEGKTQVTNKSSDFTLGEELYVIWKAAESPQDKNKMPKRKEGGKKPNKQNTNILWGQNKIKKLKITK